MARRDRDIDRIERPDVEIGAAVRAKKLRFKRRPEAEVHGESHVDDRLAEEVERAEIETGAGSERSNLPEEIEPGVTYRDVRVRWRAAAKIRSVRDRKPREG